MFKPIYGFEDYGVIDENGNIKRHKSDKIRKTCFDTRGREGLTINQKRVLVKNLVAKTFIRDYNSKTERVVYIDGNTNNHHYLNLSIEKNDRFKLSQEVAEEIRNQYKAGSKLIDLANKYNVSECMVSYVVNGKRY
ncbi:hypothetical protein ACED16_02535 [Enterobacter hormaechei]